MLKLTVALMLGNAMADKPVDMYINYCKVVDKSNSNVCVIETLDGDIYKAIDKIEVGEECYVCFDGKGTLTKIDDEILLIENSDFISNHDWLKD